MYNAVHCVKYLAEKKMRSARVVSRRLPDTGNLEEQALALAHSGYLSGEFEIILHCSEAAFNSTHQA